MWLLVTSELEAAGGVSHRPLLYSYIVCNCTCCTLYIFCILEISQIYGYCKFASVIGCYREQCAVLAVNLYVSHIVQCTMCCTHILHKLVGVYCTVDTLDSNTNCVRTSLSWVSNAQTAGNWMMDREDFKFHFIFEII